MKLGALIKRAAMTILIGVGRFAAPCDASIITPISEARFIQADAVIDEVLVGDEGVAEAWDQVTDTAPVAFAAWMGSVTALAELTLPDDSVASYSATASHDSSFSITSSRLEYQAHLEASGASARHKGFAPEGTVDGVLRETGAFAVTMFEFTIDDVFSYEGSSDGVWSLTDISSSVILASGTDLSGIIGPGAYLFQQTIDGKGGKDGVGTTRSVDLWFVVEAVDSSLPEPMTVIIWAGLAMAGLAYPWRRTNFAGGRP